MIEAFLVDEGDHELCCSNCGYDLGIFDFEEVCVWRFCPYCGKNANFDNPIPKYQLREEVREDLYTESWGYGWNR